MKEIKNLWLSVHRQKIHLPAEASGDLCLEVI